LRLRGGTNGDRLDRAASEMTPAAVPANRSLERAFLSKIAIEYRDARGRQATRSENDKLD